MRVRLEQLEACCAGKNSRSEQKCNRNETVRIHHPYAFLTLSFSLNKKKEKKETMKAIVCTGYGNPTQVLKYVTNLEKPESLKPHEVLVKVQGSSINAGDW